MSDSAPDIVDVAPGAAGSGHRGAAGKTGCSARKSAVSNIEGKPLLIPHIRMGTAGSAASCLMRGISSPLLEEGAPLRGPLPLAGNIMPVGACVREEGFSHGQAFTSLRQDNQERENRRAPGSESRQSRTAQQAARRDGHTIQRDPERLPSRGPGTTSCPSYCRETQGQIAPGEGQQTGGIGAPEPALTVCPRGPLALA